MPHVPHQALGIMRRKFMSDCAQLVKMGASKVGSNETFFLLYIFGLMTPTYRRPRLMCTSNFYENTELLLSLIYNHCSINWVKQMKVKASFFIHLLNLATLLFHFSFWRASWNKKVMSQLVNSKYIHKIYFLLWQCNVIINATTRKYPFLQLPLDIDKVLWKSFFWTHTYVCNFYSTPLEIMTSVYLF